MGIIWRSTMPLLTTLAALVIIVNSAEEDMDSEYRRDMIPIKHRPSIDYDQPWHHIDHVDPAVQSRTGDSWEVKGDVFPNYSRPGRKRKRPQDSQSAEELSSPDDPNPYYEMDLDSKHQTEMPKRRQKQEHRRKFNGRSDVLDIERSIRKTFHKARPAPPSWPMSAEFQDTDLTPDYVEVRSKTAENQKIDAKMDSTERFVQRLADNTPEFTDTGSSLLNLPIDPPAAEDIISKDGFRSSFTKSDSYIIRDKDRSLSDYSGEVIHGNKRKHDKKLKQAQRELGLSLKEILKKSNGSSLSEILQQHNVSLTDLLHGKEQAVSLFRDQTTVKKSPYEIINDAISVKTNLEPPKYDTAGSQETLLENSETKYLIEPGIKNTNTSLDSFLDEYKKEIEHSTTTVRPITKTTPKGASRQRFSQQNTRRKMHIRPMFNNTYKGQLSRDLVTLNSRKYSHHRKNITKFQQWRDVLPSMQNTSFNDPPGSDEKNSTEYLGGSLNLQNTKHEDDDVYIRSHEDTKLENVSEGTIPVLDIEVNTDSKTVTPEEATTFPSKLTFDETVNVTEKPPVMHRLRYTALATGMRHQAFNNRLKRKRMKSKNSTNENPQEDLTKRLFGMSDLVSSSEFITENPAYVSDTTEPKQPQKEIFTTPTEPSTVITSTSEINVLRSTGISSSTQPIEISTEDNAKFEIAEILRDTKTASKLCEILKARNMTLNELVQHRERGSSYVHLADIFHNASREPNPPEPFLSKSLLEPISKETYPLRALLDANSHEPNVKVNAITPDLVEKNNIPVVMNFGNNVNENAENMGIMSLFNKISNSMDNATKDVQANNDDNPIIFVNVTNDNDAGDMTRDGRELTDNHDDVVSWNEIFTLMGRNNNVHLSEGMNSFTNIRLEEDVDGDGVIVLEDLQRIKDFDRNIVVGAEEVDVNPSKKLPAMGINKDSSHIYHFNNQTKSVTIATASIVGLAMILFLLTYAAFKWKQQRTILHKKHNFGEEQIPTPIFEKRKGKNNDSLRSISPMIQTPNHYSFTTLESHNGKESPEYAWDSLRKPFR